MIDDIVQMVFAEARKKEGKDLVANINQVMLSLQLLVDMAVERLVEDKIVEAYRKA